MTGYCRQVDRLLRSAAVVSPRAPDRFAVVWLLGQATVFGLFYGTVMGSFSGLSPDRLWQVVYSAAKMPLLLLATFSLSLPSFFVINTLVGLREDFGDAVRALVTMQAVLTIILAALAPLTALWYASFSDYSAATAFNGLMFALATFSAQGMLRRTYCPLIARHPRHRAMLRVWLVTYAFVGIQMAWVLRPFVGDPSRPVEFFRDEAWANAYLVVIDLLRQLLARAAGWE